MANHDTRWKSGFSYSLPSVMLPKRLTARKIAKTTKAAMARV